MLKLLNMAQPDVAYFGQKDGQQLAVIRRMVRDLDMPVRIEAVPTVREPDGLALSSRNVRLGPADRERALALHAALQAAARSVADGERDADRVVEVARAAMSPYERRPGVPRRGRRRHLHAARARSTAGRSSPSPLAWATSASSTTSR